MTDLVNSNVINTLFNEKQFNKEFKAMLNELINTELEKDINEMDCDLIEDLTDMLIELEQTENDGFPVIIPSISAKKIISACSVHNFKSLSKGMKASLIACIILLSGITCNAAVYQITGNNIAQDIVDTIHQKLTDWGIITYAESTDTVVDEIPTGSENIDAGFEDHEETTTKPIEKPTEKPTAKPVTTRPEATGSENIDAGFEDDEPTKPEIKPTVKQYKITFYAKGGICNTKEKNVLYRKAIGDLPVPEKEGYIFGGWYNIDINYQFKKYPGAISIKEALPITSDTIYNIARDATLIAEWYELSTVTFNPDSGTCDVKTMQVNSEGKITNIPVPVRSGYTFDYWYYTEKTDSTFKTIKLTPDLVITENMTFKAHWTTNQTTFAITFDANGGTCDLQNMSVVFGEPCGELPTPVRNGYTFIGWYDGKNTHYTQYTDKTVYNTRDNLTLYALWGQDTVTVNFDSDGGVCDTEAAEFYCSLAFGKLPVPIKAGYIFNYWYYDNNGNQIKVNASDTVNNRFDGITLTAKWTPAQVEITFETNGGYINGVFNKTYYYQTPYGELPDAYYKGYKFDGWFTEPEGGEKAETDSIIQSYEPITLYAHWTEVENSVGVTVHTNRSVENTYDITYKIGDTLGDIPIPEATTDTEKLYTNFLGWYDDKYYGNKIPSDTIVTDDMNIYAHWELSGLLSSTINITGLKSIYNLNEELHLNNMTFNAKIGQFGLSMTTADITELLHNDRIPFEEHFTNADTNTVGVHRMVVTVALDETSIIGIGTITISSSIDYTVVDCEHTNNKLVKQRKSTCSSHGYTGDVICTDCGYEISKGEYIPTIPHDESTAILRNAVKPTCTCYGYTGDLCCAKCNAILKKGEQLPELGHGKTALINVKEVSCGEDGYTGDTICTVCNEILEEGKIIPKYPHSGKTELVGVTDVSCKHNGYTGDIICSDCDEILKKGETIPKYPHNSEEAFKLTKAPTCSSFGEGYYYCIDCGSKLRYINTIAKLPHGNEILTGKKEATCTEDGHTGNYVCEICQSITKQGKTIPKLGHQNTEVINVKAATCYEDGYTGDTICKDCSEIITKGSVINKTHNYEYINNKAVLGKDGFIGRRCKECGAVSSDSKTYKAIASISLDKNVYYYCNSPITPTITVLDSEGKKITNYKAVMPAGRQEIGTYTIKLTFNGGYSGTHYLDFEIKDNDVIPEITNLSKIKNGITAEWETVDGADGYELKLINSNGNPIRTIHVKDGATSVNVIVSNKLDMYAIVRAYEIQTINGEEIKIYSEWSDPVYLNS